MTTINISEDCGNAPKKRLLKDLNVAFAENDPEFVLDSVADDVVWTIVGDREIDGKAAVADALEQMTDEEDMELTLHSVITHGTSAAVDGDLMMADGNTYAFCDVYEFSGHSKNAKVRTMRSYVTEVDA